MAELQLIFSSGGLLVGLGMDTTQDAIAATRDVVVGGGTADDVLTVLTSSGLAATPTFFCAEAVADDVRVLLRGDVSVDVRRSDDGLDHLTAGRSGTWRDDVVSRVETILLSAGGVDVEWRPNAAYLDGQPDQNHPPAPEGTVANSATSTGEGEEVHTLAEIPDLQPPELGLPPETPPAPTNDPFDFSNLLDSTKFRDVESAAVREQDSDPASAVTSTAEHDGMDGATTASVSHEAPPLPTQDNIIGPSGTSRGVISDIPNPDRISVEPPVAEIGQDWSGLGDHDGHTVALGGLHADAALSSTTGAGTASGSGIRAILCPSEHPNPPTAVRCRVCDIEIVDRSVQSLPRPVLARLVFSTGLVIDVDRPQMIGRRPTADDYSVSTEIPNLITLASPESDISRNHASIRVEGWNLLIEDEGSTNGTEVKLPGQDLMRLREHSPLLVVPGTEIVLADTVRFTIEVPR